MLYRESTCVTLSQSCQSGFNDARPGLSIFISIFTLGFLYLRYTPETFESSTTLQINIKDQGEEILNINSFEQTSNINSIVELMKSEIIINKAIKKLDLQTLYYSEGEILSRNIYKNAPFLIKDLNIKDSSSVLEQKIYVKQNKSYIELHNENESKIYSKYIIPNEYFSTPFFSGYFYVKDIELLKKTLKDDKLYFVFPKKQSLINEINENLKIEIADPAANTIDVSFTHNNPIFTADICNSITNEYIKYDLNKKAISSINIVNYINSQKDSVELRLKDSEQKIQVFKKQYDVKSSDLSKNSALFNIEKIEDELMKVTLDINMLYEIKKMFTRNIDLKSTENLMLSKFYYKSPLYVNEKYLYGDLQ